MSTVNEIVRGTLGSHLRALVYSTLIAALVNNAYDQIVLARVMHPGTVVMGGPLGDRHEIAGFALFLMLLAKTRVFLISAFVLCLVLLLIVSPVCAWLRSTRFGSQAWTVPGCGALGAIVGLALAQGSYPLVVGDSVGVVLAGIGAGLFLAVYLTRRRGWT